MVRIRTPWGLNVVCHQLIAKRFAAACEEANRVSTWKPRRIDSYASRPIRGSSTLSLHARAMAFDFFNRPLPQPVDVWGPTNAPDKPFRDAFKRHGFALGAEYRNRKDYPHIEWADVPPSEDGVIPPPPPLSEEDDVTPQDIEAIADRVVAKLAAGVLATGNDNAGKPRGSAGAVLAKIDQRTGEIKAKVGA